MSNGSVWWLAGFVACVAGLLVTSSSVRLLGRVRAAANWPTAPPMGRASRAASRAGTAIGLLLLGGGVLLVAVGVVRPAHPVGWLLVVIASALALLGGGMAAARMAENAELTTLIRTPPAANPIPPQDQRPGLPAGREQDTRKPAGSTLRDDRGVGASASAAPDPAVPSDGRPGWVYRDPEGDWYLAVAADEPGQRLVRLSDFALVPSGTVTRPLRLAGSVEIAVYPVAEAHTGTA